MKPYLNHIAAIALSALVLFSTLSFSVDMHYCGKKLVAVALNNKAHGCGMEAPLEKPANDDAESRIGIHCCEDVMLAFEGQEDLQHPVFEVTFAKFFSTPAAGYFAPRLQMVSRTFHFREYSPPLLIRDIPLLNQTFLI